MNWIGGLCILLALLVCAELYSMRNTIRELRDEVEALRERLKRNLKDITIEMLMEGRG
jgi:cell division protein ZapA (FtsZ GTPase activity inhibitor)